MGIRRRLIAAFMTVLGLLVGFALFQTWVYQSISEINGNLIQLSSMTQNIEKIRQAQNTYLDLNARRYIGVIEEALDAVKGDSQALLAKGLRSSKKLPIAEISDYYIAYQDGLKRFISTNDQYHALKVEGDSKAKALYDLVAAMPPAVKEQTALVNTSPVEITIWALRYSSRDYEVTANEVESLTALKKIGADLMRQGKSFEVRIFGRRLSSLATINQETLWQIDTVNLENQALLYAIDQELRKLYDLLTQMRIAEQAYANKLLLQLQILYWSVLAVSLFVVIFFVLRLTRRIGKGVEVLVKGAERIASGDYSEEVELAGDDEFSVVTRHMNKMMESLRMSNLSIKTYSNQLEHLVSAKTRELQRANEQLEELNTTLAKEKDRFAKLALTDMLTGLNNRAYLIEALSQKVDEAKRYGKTFSLLLLDIDHFKNINDYYGHLVGDSVLRQFGKLLKRETRVSDIVARFGGEEFMVIFTEANLVKALQISERIRHAVAVEQFELEGLRVTISGGVLCYKGETETELLKRVDDLLYVAKREGRNRIISTGQ